MPARLQPNWPNPGLNDSQKTRLAELEMKPLLSEYNVGELRALSYFGREEDRTRAEKLLRKAANQHTKTQQPNKTTIQKLVADAFKEANS